MLYTRPEGSWTQRDAIRERMTEGGVLRCTTKFTGTKLSRLVAWLAVRGNPSRMKEAEESIEGEDGVAECEDSDCGRSQPLVFISSEIKFRIIESGTRLPDCIAASAWTPALGLDICFPCATGLLLTEWCASAHILAQQITRAD